MATSPRCVAFAIAGLASVAFGSVAHAAAPANDNFVDRITLTGSSDTVSGTTVGATKETGESDHGWVPPNNFQGYGGTVWWTWTAPSSGTATFVLTGTGILHSLSIYTGSTLATLQGVAIVGDDPLPLHPTFAAIAGTTYQIVVQDRATDGGAPFSFTFAMPPSPANDFFADAAPIVGASATVTGDNVNASPENDEPTYYRNSVWWTWTAPTTGTAMVNTTGSTFDSALFVYTGTSVDALTVVVTGFRPASGDHAQKTSFSAVAGITYRFQISGISDLSPSGSIVLNLETVAPPANDAFVNRLAVMGASASFSGTTNGATRESNEPDYPIRLTGNTVWWTWTAPSTGTATIATPTAGRQLHVFSGDTLAGLVVVTNTDTSSAAIRRKYFHAVAGVTYTILVDGDDGAIGAFSGALSLVAGPPNDLEADAIVLSGNAVSTTGDNSFATADLGEQNYFSDPDQASLWWTWTAPGDGAVAIDTAGSTIDAYLQAGGRQDHGAGGSFSQVVVNVAAGANVKISADGWNAARGSIKVNLQFWPKPVNDTEANATVITDTSHPILGTNRGASAGSPDFEFFSEIPNSGYLGVHGGASVWWKWTAPTSGPIAISTTGSSFVPLLVVTDGSFVRGSNIAEPQRAARPGIAFFAQAGHTYTILADGRDRTMGDIVLHFVSGPPPTINAEPTSQVVRFLTSVTLNVDATSAQGELGYQWMFDSTPILGARGAALALSTPLSSAPYSCIVFDDSGVTMTTPATMAVTFAWIDNAPSAVAAGGSVTLTASTPPFATIAFQWKHNGVPIPGATSRAYTVPSAQAFHDGAYSVEITLSDNTTFSSNAVSLDVSTPAPSASRLLNLSARAQALTGDDGLIPGFVVAGTGTKKLLIRAVGPTLGKAPFNLTGVLADPTMRLLKRNASTSAFEEIAANDNWGTNANAAAITQTAIDLSAFAFNDSLESALLMDLTPGEYTAIAGGVNDGTGLAIVELYDADSGSPTARLANISNRGFAGVGNQVMIPGFVVSSEGPKTLLVRVVGPTLGDFGVANTMVDPKLEVFPVGANTPILSNDNWGDSSDAANTAAVATQVFAFPLTAGSKDAAIVVTLQPGSYTVVGSSAVSGGTGVVLVEVYVVP